MQEKAHPVLKLGLAKAESSRGRWQEASKQTETIRNNPTLPALPEAGLHTMAALAICKGHEGGP